MFCRTRCLQLWLFMSFGFAGCRSPADENIASDGPVIALSDDTEATQQEVLKHIPVGSRVKDATTILEKDGFSCSHAKASDGQDYLYCVVQKPWRGPVVEKWQVQVFYDDKGVTDAVVSHGLVGP